MYEDNPVSVTHCQRRLAAKFQFGSVKEVMAKANEQKSGDVLAGLAATSDSERVAAKEVLSNLLMSDLRNSPAVAYEEDDVTRMDQDGVDSAAYNRIKNWTVGEFREWLLSYQATEEAIKEVRKGLTAEMIAGVAKLMSNLDLIYAANKMRVESTCNTTAGIRGTFSTRLQPNHPTDDVEGITASLFEGLSYGCGDMLIGLNPVNDSAASCREVLKRFDEVKNRWQIPTQICVLAHITTQMEAVRQGAPTDMIFQSIAGSQKGNEAFGFTTATVREAQALLKERGTAKGPNVMYFETGQGSELSSNAHFGTDQVTMEARCYAYAKQFNPFMVNTVVGFIGPEYLYDSKQVLRAGLEDHFMGKLTGIPMGCDACYTNHMQADQNDLESGALEQIRTLPIKKALLVCDPFLSQNGGVKFVTDQLEAMGAQWELFDQIVPNPTVDLVSSGVGRILAYQPDTVIALGGGSAIDSGKAISFIYTKMSGAEKPLCIAIPTTSGTGSEATSFSVLSDPSVGSKYPLVDDRMLPDVALLAPSLTVSVPPHVTADTGLDVLTHAVEAFVSPVTNDFTDALAEKAVHLVFEYLPRAVKNGQDVEARERLHNASCMAGMAFNNATLGLCHGMAHAMGELLHLPHGRSNAMLLPHVIAFNAGLGEQGDFPARARYAKLAKLAGCCCYNETVAVQSLVKKINELMTEVGMPRKLESEEHRAKVQDHLDTLAKAALADRCTAGNPREAQPEQITRLYQKLV